VDALSSDRTQATPDTTRRQRTQTCVQHASASTELLSC
jgi:hypothetical protein